MKTMTVSEFIEAFDKADDPEKLNMFQAAVLGTGDDPALYAMHRYENKRIVREAICRIYQEIGKVETTDCIKLVEG